jgi:hypothetical protein
MGFVGLIKVGLDYANRQGKRSYRAQSTNGSASRHSVDTMKDSEQMVDWDYQPPTE